MKVSEHMMNSLQIWAKGFLPEGSEGNDIESDQESWAVGAHITTKLINPSGEVRHVKFYLVICPLLV